MLGARSAPFFFVSLVPPVVNFLERILKRVPTITSALYILDRHDHLADRPDRQDGEFQMRPGEGQADDGDGPAQRDDDGPEREPPAGEDQPEEVAERTQRSGAESAPAGIGGA